MNLELRKYNIAIFASGTGSNFINIHECICNGSIRAKLNLLISNNPNCKAIDYAKANNIKYKIINSFRFSNDEIDSVMLETLSKYEIDLIALAGYMKKVPKKVIKYYNNRILNIHPSLLPKFGGKGFYGMKVHEAVIDSKEKNTGVTIHFVDNHYDTGNIIHQEAIQITKDDTASSIAKKVLEMEHRLYPEIIRKICENNIN